MVIQPITSLFCSSRGRNSSFTSGYSLTSSSFFTGSMVTLAEPW